MIPVERLEYYVLEYFFVLWPIIGLVTAAALHLNARYIGRHFQPLTDEWRRGPRWYQAVFFPAYYTDSFPVGAPDELCQQTWFWGRGLSAVILGYVFHTLIGPLGLIGIIGFWSVFLVLRGIFLFGLFLLVVGAIIVACFYGLLRRLGLKPI